MSVSGNEESGVLSRKSSTVSSGIPLKKRRFLLVQPPSPPRQEIPLRPPLENDANKEGDSSFNMSYKEESNKELKNKEESQSDLKRKEDFSSDAKNNEGSCSKSKSKQASELNLNNNAESGTDLKNKENSISDQGYLEANLVNTSLGMSDVGINSLIEVKKDVASDPKMNLIHPNLDASGSKLLQLSPMANLSSVSELDSRTKLLLTEKSNVVNSSLVIPDVVRNSLIQVKKEIASDTNINLGHSNMDASGSKLQHLSPMANMGSVGKLDSITKLLLTEKCVSTGFPGTTTGAHVADIEKEMHNTPVDDDCRLKLSTGTLINKLSSGPSSEPLAPALRIPDKERNFAEHDKLDTALLSLSFNKGKTHVEEKNNDASSGRGTSNCEWSNRSKWDLNTAMDDWEGSAGDVTFQGTIDALSKKNSVDVTNPSFSSTGSGIICSSKGKQVLLTDMQSPLFSTSCIQKNYQAEDPRLHLTLSTVSRASSARMASAKDVSLSTLGRASSVGMASAMDVSKPLVSAVNINSPGCGTVKSEPLDDNPKNISVGATGSNMGLLDLSSVKREPSERNIIEAVRLSTNISQKLIEQKSIKLEQAAEVSQVSCKTGKVISQHSVANVAHCQESGSSSSSSSLLSMPSTPQKCSPSRLITSSDLSASIDVSNQSEHSFHTKKVQKSNDVIFQSTAVDAAYKPVHMNGEAKMSDCKLDTLGPCEAEARRGDDPEMARQKRMNQNSHDFHTNHEESVSDEEKINLSTEMIEDESYGSDCDSDGNQAIANHLGSHGRCHKDDEDYEDGEVREPVVHSAVDEPFLERMDTEDTSLDNQDCKDSAARELASGRDTDQFLVEKESESTVYEDKTVECIKECVGNASNEDDDQLMDKDGSLQNFIPDGVAGEGADGNFLSSPSQRKSLDLSGKGSVSEVNEKDIPCDGTTSSGHRTMTTRGESTNGNAKLVGSVEKPDSSICVIDSSLSGNDAAKDSINGLNRSRIIHLPRTSATSPGRTRSIADGSLLSRTGRDKYSDTKGGKFLVHRNRDEVDTDGPRRFIREKIYDQPYRNSRPYGRGRGRFSGRLDTSRGEWDTEHGSSLSTGRGRKPLNDDLHSFRHPSSRRLSPGGRDGPSTSDIRMFRRIPQNFSPNRRNDGNRSDLVGPQHDEKLLRSSPDEIIDPAYTRPQTLYDSGDGQFVRGNRNFSTVQRRDFCRAHLKSPVGSRARSPGPWSPHRRRSPDGFGGIPQINQHRSAAVYEMERIRSPDRSCFPEEMVRRRRGSPSFIARPSNDMMRDAESGRDHGHPRLMNSTRMSPSDRVFARNTRRLDISDTQMGTGEDEYFGRPAVHSNRFHEFQRDGSNDERRKYNERRGVARSFRPPYTGDGENLRFPLDEGPRPYRFCAEGGNTEFGGRSMREREFDGRIKDRPVVAPRRIRNIEDPEGNYHESRQVWHDDGFDESPGFKRRRF